MLFYQKCIQVKAIISHNHILLGVWPKTRLTLSYPRRKATVLSGAILSTNKYSSCDIQEQWDRQTLRDYQNIHVTVSIITTISPIRGNPAKQP